MALVAAVVVLTLLALFALTPVYVMLSSSLKPLQDVQGVFRWIPSAAHRAGRSSTSGTTVPLGALLRQQR